MPSPVIRRLYDRAAWFAALSFLSISLCIALPGCQGVTSAKLLGVWRLEGAEQLAELMTGGKRPAGSVGAILDSAVEMVSDQLEASMDVEFRSGGRLITRSSFGGKPTEKSGTWKVIRSSESEIVIWCQLGEEDPNEITVTIIDEQTIKMVPPNIAVLKKSFEFKRVEE